MGDMPEDLDSKREYYYYNTDNKLVGSSTFGRKYTDKGYSDEFSLTNIIKSVFDADGKMTLITCSSTQKVEVRSLLQLW